VKEREDVFIVSQGITEEHAEKLGFTHFPNVQAAFSAAYEKHGSHAKITVLTHAPDMLPIITKRE
jgi:hypothetical protein